MSDVGTRQRLSRLDATSRRLPRPAAGVPVTPDRPLVQWLETRVPPPIVMMLFGLAAFGAARALPALSFRWPLQVPMACALLLVGLGLNLLPKVAFKRARTTVNPLRPQAATALVTSGVYRYTRNPMYLGHACLLLALACALANAAAFLAMPAFVLYVTRFQILPEERFLSGRFPDAYAALSRRAPRWL